MVRGWRLTVPAGLNNVAPISNAGELDPVTLSLTPKATVIFSVLPERTHTGSLLGSSVGLLSGRSGRILSPGHTDRSIDMQKTRSIAKFETGLVQFSLIA